MQRSHYVQVFAKLNLVEFRIHFKYFKLHSVSLDSYTKKQVFAVPKGGYIKVTRMVRGMVMAWQLVTELLRKFSELAQEIALHSVTVIITSSSTVF